MSRGIAWGLRICLVGAALWLLWVEWRPSVRSWPEDPARPETAEALRRLPVGRDFLISGRVEPLPGASVREWQGRFVFRHRQRQDQSGSSGKSVRVVTVAEHRPALRWVWAGGTWALPADSYGLEHAPRIVPRVWPRKWLGTTRVDDWDKSSRGFRAGEAALAYGFLDEASEPRVKLLLQTPLEAVTDDIGHTNRMRQGLVLAAKIILSLFVISLCLRRRNSQQPERGGGG